MGKTKDFVRRHHRAAGRLLAAALAFVLLAGALPAPALAAGAPGAQPQGLDPGPQARQAAAWLREQLPAPGPQDAAAALALLRSGQLAPDEQWAQDFYTAMETHLNGGGAEGQPVMLSAWQALALAAGGRALPGKLNTALAAAAGGEDAEAMACALLALTAAQGGLPWGQGSLEELAARLAAAAHADGGFGAGEASDPLATALALQALSFYKDLPEAAAGIDAAAAFLQEHAAAYGGFTMAGAPSPEATAQVAIAQACLGRAQLGSDLPEPAELLLAYQDEAGGFAANPDAEADPALTAVCLLALAARARQNTGLPGVYAFGAGEGSGAPDDDSTGQAGGGGGWRLPGLGAVPPWVVAAIAGGVVVLLVLLAIPAARRQKKRQRRLLRLEAAGRKAGETGEEAEKNPPEKKSPAKASSSRAPKGGKGTGGAKSKKPYHKL